jgi:hypothetical protein
METLMSYGLTEEDFELLLDSGCDLEEVAESLTVEEIFEFL